MHFVIICHTLLCLEVLVLYPSYLTSVDALHTVSGNFSLGRAFTDGTHRLLSLTHTHKHTHSTFVQSPTQTLVSDYWLKQS